MVASPAASAGVSPRTLAPAVAWPDAGVAVAAVVLSLVFWLGGPTAGASWRETALYLVLTVAQALPLLWRRRRPKAVATAVVAAALLHAVLVGPAAPYPTWFAVYALGVYVLSLREAVSSAATAVLAASAVFVLGPVAHGRGSTGALPTLLLTVVIVLASALVRTERGRLDALRQRAASLERERDAASREATARERLRIARDLHDLVGHGLSTIAVQSSTARVLLEAGETEAAGTRLQAVEQSSRAAMQEMRQLLTVLREEHTHQLTPSPGIEDLAKLVDTARDGGLQVDLQLGGDVSAVPAPVGLAAYRILQESLTNVMKHAPGARAKVTVDVSRDGLRLEVRNGAGTGCRSDGSGGHGLVGIHERVQSLGGVVDAGPAEAGGGWRVVAVLPLHRPA